MADLVQGKRMLSVIDGGGSIPTLASSFKKVQCRFIERAPGADSLASHPRVAGDPRLARKTRLLPSARRQDPLANLSGTLGG
jgi:hypothetical protein